MIRGPAAWSYRAVTGIAVLRTALGATAILRPTLALRPWVGRPGTGPAAVVLSRAAGARDIALGAGALLAGFRGDDRAVRTWARAGAFCDLADAFITLGAWRDLPSRGRVAVMGAALGAAVLTAVATAAPTR